MKSGILSGVAVILMCAGPVHAQPASSRILVMPLENVGRDNRILWLTEAAAVLLADDLNALGVSAIAREERRRAFERLQVPPAATLTDATVIRIGQLVGASDVVVGTLRLDDDELVVQVRSIALESGRIVKNLSERGPMPDLFGLCERLARGLGFTSRTESARMINPPVAAFENYIKGLLAETPDTGISYLQTALKLDPTLDRARLALWEIYQDQGEYARALAAVRAIPATSRWSSRSRFLAGLSEMDSRKYDEAFETLTRLAQDQPTANVLNNLGVVQLRRGGPPVPAEAPASYFKRASETDPTDPDYFFNLGYAYWSVRDLQAAMYWLREAVRRSPADGDAHFVLGAALGAAGNPTEANREKELARRLSSVYQEWEKRSPVDPVPKGLERVKTGFELPRTGGLEETLATTGQRDQQELAHFYLNRGRRAFEEERNREALLDLNRALFLSPYEAEAHLLLGRLHLRAGQLHEAIDAFKISLWSADTADAHAALAQAYLDSHDVSAATTEIDRALVLDPASAIARQLKEKIAATR